MEHDEFGSDDAGIIVAENGQLVAEDLWNGFDAGSVRSCIKYICRKMEQHFMTCWNSERILL